MRHTRTLTATSEKVRHVANRHKAMMMAATLARMAGGLLTFVLLARYLHPEPFGLIATAMAYTAFMGILTDFGLGTAALRDAAAVPDQSAQIMADALAVKGLLAALIVLVGGLALTFLMPFDRLLIYGFVFAGALAYSFGELSLVAARANGRFDLEAKTVIASSVVMLVLVGGVAALTGAVMPVAIAFFVTRLGYLLLVLVTLRRWLGNPFTSNWSGIVSTGRRASSYAADSCLTSLATQIDVLLFGVFLSLHDMGIYQSGARLVQVIVPFAVVLSTVYLPSLVAARTHGRDVEYRGNATRLTWEFTCLAVLSGLGFTFVAPAFTDLLYGNAYRALQPLWPGFAVFACLRLAASAYGVQLVALGRIRARLINSVASIAVLFGTTLLVMPKFGLASSTWILALSAVPPFLFLGTALMRTGLGGRHVLGSMVLTLTVVAVLVAAQI